MLLRRKFVSMLALTMLPAMACHAAWMRTEGEVGLSTGLSMSDNGSFFDRDGTRARNRCGFAIDAPVQVEYGVSYYRTVYGSTSLTSYGCGAGQSTGFTDFELGMRGRVDLLKNDQTWELAAIIPNSPGAKGATQRPKHFGVKLGINSSDRVDPYQSFLAGDISSKHGEVNVFTYGAGINMWKGHIPNELSGYLGWGHTLADPVWQNETGGWYFSARLDGSKSFGKAHSTTVPANALLVHDAHDKYSLLTAHVGVSHSLTRLSSVQFVIKQGVWGRNVASPSGIHIGYSTVWRD